MIIGFTDTQRGMTPDQIAAIARFFAGRDLEARYADDWVTFHHGDCIGADAQAHWRARAYGWHVVVHPPEYRSKRAFCRADEKRDPAPYLVRNHAIVDECDLLVATPGEMVEQRRSGTWATIRYARKIGKPVQIVWPDGTREPEGQP